MIHKLKIWTEYVTSIELGIKTFEIRKNDRNYKVGDILQLQGYNIITKKYTDEQIKVKVLYIFDDSSFGLEKGYCVMSIKPIEDV